MPPKDDKMPPSYDGYDKIIETLRGAQRDNEAEQEKARQRERMARSQAAIGGIADVGRALSNLFFTTRYAPNGYDEKQAMSPKARERAERYGAERERLKKEWNNYSLQMANAQAGKEREERLWRQHKEDQAKRQEQLRQQKERQAKAEEEKQAATAANNQKNVWMAAMYDNAWCNGQILGCF